MPPLTREVQEWIWHRQNPPRENCSASKYLLVDNIVQQVCAGRDHEEARRRRALRPCRRRPDRSQPPVAFATFSNGSVIVAVTARRPSPTPQHRSVLEACSDPLGRAERRV